MESSFQMYQTVFLYRPLQMERGVLEEYLTDRQCSFAEESCEGILPTGISFPSLPLALNRLFIPPQLEITEVAMFSDVESQSRSTRNPHCTRGEICSSVLQTHLAGRELHNHKPHGPHKHTGPTLGLDPS